MHACGIIIIVKYPMKMFDIQKFPGYGKQVCNAITILTELKELYQVDSSW